MIRRVALALLLTLGCNKDAPESESTANTGTGTDATANDSAKTVGAGKQTDTKGTTMSKQQQAYEKLVADKTHPDFSTETQSAYDFGNWRFFHQVNPDGFGAGMVRNQGAVNDAGHAVGKRFGGDDDWRAFLTDLMGEGLGAEGAHARVAWMLGVMPFVPGQPGLPDNPEFRKMLTAPKLEKRGDGTLVLEGWTASPPNVEELVLLRVEVPQEGKAKVELVPGHQVGRGKK